MVAASTSTSDFSTSYTSPRWLVGGHLQTIYPARVLVAPPLTYRRERWTTPDHDFIDIDFVDGGVGSPFVALFHGLEGDSESNYAWALMSAVRERGWSGAVVHFRGCSGELNIAPRFYHSGDSEEANWVLRRLEQSYRVANPQGKFFAAGVSLGGNVLLRWLGESQTQAQIVDAAVSVSAPLDLAAGGASLSNGFNMIYTRSFLKTLRPKCLKKLEQFPNLFDRDAMLAARDLYEFDNIVTAPLHGYRNTDDYWHRASAKLVLNDICVRTLVLNAQNDPFLPARFLPQQASTMVTLDYPKHGGHVGFSTGLFPGKIDWLPQRILNFFTQSL
jgi:uncharacterized protein